VAVFLPSLTLMRDVAPLCDLFNAERCERKLSMVLLAA
jgi:hypothetical protein